MPHFFPSFFAPNSIHYYKLTVKSSVSATNLKFANFFFVCLSSFLLFNKKTTENMKSSDESSVSGPFHTFSHEIMATAINRMSTNTKILYQGRPTPAKRSPTNLRTTTEYLKPAPMHHQKIPIKCFLF